VRVLRWRVRRALILPLALAISTAGCLLRGAYLLSPHASHWQHPAPATFHVLLKTTKGDVDIEVRREWAPIGVDRFYNLIEAGYYDSDRIFRMVKGKWAQFGINGDPDIAKAWRAAPIADDPRVLSNTRGTLAYAFAVPNGRTTQLFINLADNSATHDKEPFVPIGRVVSGMDVVDRWYDGYGESAVGGIRAGKQDAFFDGGNAFLDAHFPKLDSIVRATVR
jgi:cyclophilin family peptidyl-prolyl cis-trans isomerase